MSYIIYISFAYTCHLILCFMPVKTLEMDTRNNCMYPKVQSLYQTTISIYPKRGRYNDPNGTYVIDLNGASISVNCMLQQLYPYKHVYLSNYPVISRQSVLLCFFNNLSGIRKRYLIISCILMRYSLALHITIQLYNLYTISVSITNSA